MGKSVLKQKLNNLNIFRLNCNMHGSCKASRHINIKIATRLEDKSDSQLIWAHDGDRQKRKVIVKWSEIEKIWIFLYHLFNAFNILFPLNNWLYDFSLFFLQRFRKNSLQFVSVHIIDEPYDFCVFSLLCSCLIEWFASGLMRYFIVDENLNNFIMPTPWCNIHWNTPTSFEVQTVAIFEEVFDNFHVAWHRSNIKKIVPGVFHSEIQEIWFLSQRFFEGW